MGEAQFSRSQDIYDEDRSWQYRCLRASFGTTTGIILQAVLGRPSRVGQAFGPTCDIMLDGTVETMHRPYSHQHPHLVRIGKIDAVRDNFRRLAEHCRLADRDQEALFEELRKWVRLDHRAESGIDRVVAKL